MTPEQMKINPIKPIIKVNTNEELDTEEGESNKDEQESTISIKEEDDYSTFSDMSKLDSESDINVHDTQDEQNTHTPETLQIHNTYNTTMHDKADLIHEEYDTSEDENIIEIETFEHYQEKIHETEESIPTETSQVLYAMSFMKDEAPLYVDKFWCVWRLIDTLTGFYPKFKNPSGLVLM